MQPGVPTLAAEAAAARLVIDQCVQSIDGEQHLRECEPPIRAVLSSERSPTIFDSSGKDGLNCPFRNQLSTCGELRDIEYSRPRGRRLTRRLAERDGYIIELPEPVGRRATERRHRYRHVRHHPDRWPGPVISHVKQGGIDVCRGPGLSEHHCRSCEDDRRNHDSHPAAVVCHCTILCSGASAGVMITLPWVSSSIRCRKASRTSLRW
jgi:hypothetical protein